MTTLADHLGSRKLSWEAAAQKSGLSADRLRAVAAGAEASLGEMRKIAKVLRLPLSAITESEQDRAVTPLFRQTLGQQSAVDPVAIAAVSGQIADLLDFAKSAEIPSNVGWLDLFRGRKTTINAAEDFAALFRHTYADLDDEEPFSGFWQVLAEKLNVLVTFSRDPSVEGVSAIVDGYAVALVAARTFAPRVLFTLAHEVGHLVAHHEHQQAGYALFDRERDVGGIRAPRRVEEKFADAFASALLLPRKGVLLALKEIRALFGATGQLGDIEILALARFFSVGFEVAARRCESLGLLPPQGAQALYQQLKSKHGTPERRADEAGLPPREPIDLAPSSVLIDAALRMVRSGLISVGRASEILNVSVEAIYAANVGQIE